MKLSLNGAMQTKQKNQFVTGFSKSYEPGDTTRVFYPIFWDENNEPQLCVGVRCGHSVNDYHGLGLKASFITTLSPLDEDYNPIVHDIAYKFAKSVAPAIWAGQYKAEEAVINSKQWPNEAMKKEALKALDAKYDTKSNMKAVKPIISKYQMLILAEPLVCKVTNGKVNTESARTYVQKVSGDLTNKLNILLHDKKYAPEPGADYFEVEYVYAAGVDKMQCGKTLPSGLTSEFRMHNNDPEGFAKIRSMINNLTTDSEVIASHFAKPVEESRILQAFTNYVYMNSQYLDNLSSDSEEVKRITEEPSMIEDLCLARCLSNKELAAALEAATGNGKAHEPAMNDAQSILASMESETPASDQPPVLENLITNPNAVTNQNDLSAIDFGSADLNV